MAHELETRNGGVSFVATRQSAWHGLGTVLPNAPTYEEAIEIARLDYPVEAIQTYRPHVNSDGDTVYNQTGAFVTVRTDTQKELGVVTGDYKVVQNSDAFRILRPLTEVEGVAHIETAGVLRDGADAWMLLKLDLDRFGGRVKEVFGEEVVPYILVANNHSGRRGILVALTPIRVVCANTLGFAEGGKDKDMITVRHTLNAEERLTEAAETLWGNIIGRYQALAEAYDLLKHTTLTDPEFLRLVVKPMAPDPTEHGDWNPEAKMAESVFARFKKRREGLYKLWIDGTGHTGDKSAWEAYNASAEALDHYPDLFPTRGGVYRTASLLDGTLRAKKQQVLSNLVGFAKSNK